MYKKTVYSIVYFLLFAGAGFAQGQEPIVEENGRFRETYNLGADGFKHGPYSKFYVRPGRRSLLIERGEFAGGDRNGHWEMMGGKGVFKDGQKVGVWVYRLSNGRMAQKFNHSTGEVSVRGRIAPFRNYKVHFPDGTVEEKTPGQIPIPVGGEATMMYADLMIEYPAAAVNDRLSGEVLIHVVIDASGERTEAVIKESLGAIFDDEAMRYVDRLDRWVPGTDQGGPVKVSFDLPVMFRLQ